MENRKMRRSIYRIATIGAFLMAFSCTLKITAFYLGMPMISQGINLVMNAVIVLGCYQLGRAVKMPATHKLLCGVAFLGYLMYSLILFFNPTMDAEHVSEMILAFFIITLVASIAFLIALIKREIEEDKRMMDEMEGKSKTNKQE